MSPVPEERAPRRVLVTGGAGGLGGALVEGFRARGDDVVAADVIFPVVEEGEGRTRPGTTGSDGSETLVSTDRSPARAAQREADARSSTNELHLDVRSDDDWAAVRDWVQSHWGGLDVLVNNAGVAGGGRVDVAGLDEWEWIAGINLFGVVRGTRTFVPMLKQQRSGHIVNIASLAGLVHPAGMGSYNAVKAGVVAFSETCAHELAEWDVRCSVVCPSYFRTGLVEGMRGTDTAVGQVVGGLVAGAPLGPEDIAAAVLEGMDRGEELILPDPAARAAYDLKLADRPAYDQLMRKQAARLHAMSREQQ